MIPKKIHYFWFGGNEKPKSVLKCIESWKRFCPDYEIIEWNESNFDVNIMPYTKQAYDAKKYAFVSDVARLVKVYEEGGIYMDTDVEVLKPLDDLLENKAYMSFENNENINTGQGFGAEKGDPFLADHIEDYKNACFINADGSFNLTPCTKYTTNLMVSKGLITNGEKQTVADVTIYPAKFFNPYNSLTGELRKHKETYSIHWYNASWESISQTKLKIHRFIRRVFGVERIEKIKGIFDK